MINCAAVLVRLRERKDDGKGCWVDDDTTNVKKGENAVEKGKKKSTSLK